MKTLKNVLAIFLCIVMVLGLVPMVVVAGDVYTNVPEMTQSEGMFVLAEGLKFEGAYGRAAITQQGHLPGYSSSSPAEIRFTNPVLANYSYFEFDYYVENIGNFTARNTKLYLNLRASDNKSKALYDFTEQLANTGWNHVKVTVTDLNADTLNSITKARFYIDIDAGETGAADSYKIANICATKDPDNMVPEMIGSEGMFVLAEGLKFEGAYGSTAITQQGHLPGYSPAEIIFTNPVLANYSYFEFDYFVENFENFSARNTKLYLNLRAADNKSKGIFEFTSQLTETGWNHVKIDITELDADTLNSITKARFYIDIDAGETGAADSYKIANICATKDPDNMVPEMIGSEGMFVLAEGLKFEGAYGSTAITQQGHLPGYSPAEIIFTNPVLANYSYFEFDYYVENFENFSARNTKLYLNLRAADNKSKALYDFTEQLTKTGWNHVKIDITELDADTLNSITKARFYIDIDAGETGAEDVYKVANICTTKALDETVPNITQSDDVLVLYEGVKFEGVLGDTAITGQGHLHGFSSGNPAEIRFTNTGLADYGCFEFDFFIDSISNFNTRSTRMYFNVRTDSTSKGTFEFTEQIIKSGWNHIKITTDLDGNTLNSIVKIRFYMDISLGVDGTNDRYKIANICGVKGETASPSKPIYNPIVNVGEDQSVVYITWFTDNDKPAKLVFNEIEITPFDSGASDDGVLYYHRAKVTGLEENTVYTYSVGNEETLSDAFTLKTKDFDNEFSFVQVSDVQLNGNSSYLANWNITLSQINANLPDTSFILDTGDIADTTKTELFGYYKTPEILTGYITSAIHGNHGSTPNSYFSEHFTVPETYETYLDYARSDCDYWFGYNSVLFISLNTNIEDINYHKSFIQKIIEAQGDKYNWIIVNCHHSMFGASYHRNEGNTTSFRGSLAPFFSEMGVDMVLSGHDHCYARSYMMEGANPNVSSENFSANTDGGVLYVSAQSASALKFNSAEAGAEEYSAKLVESKFGFISYDVTDAAITLTYYSSADMSVLDKFTLYKDDGNHTVEPDKNLLKDKNLENILLDSNGEYIVQFEGMENISSSCSVELDLGVKDSSLTAITVSLIDSNGNSISKNFTGIKVGWNNLSTKIADMIGNVDLSKIIALKVKGMASGKFAMANLYVGHTYSDDEDITCEVCGNERNLLMDPNKVPSIKVTDYMSVVYEGVKYEGTFGSAELDEYYLPGYSSTNSIFVSNPEFDTYDYFEFDFYIENIDNFKERVSSIQFVAWRTKTKKFEFVDQISKSGWNHIKIKISYDNEDEKTYLNDAQQVRFYITMSAGEVGSTDRYRVANICATMDGAKFVPELNNRYRTMDSIVGAQQQIELLPGENPFGSSTDKHIFELSKTLVTTFAEYIEMDIYVSADVNSNAAFWVSDSKDGMGACGKYALPADLKSGWNHVIIKITDTLQTKGDFEFKGCRFDYLLLDGEFYTSAHLTGGTVRIANLSITMDIVAPTDVMKDNIGFIETDLELTSFDGNGVCMFVFKIAKDISSTKMIEVDVYVESLETITLEIMDSNGNYATYEFNGLTPGWNHLAVRISDLVQGDENDDNIDLSDICYFTLWGDANSNIVVANAYAADYIEGDANRDGVLDARDIVRAKKIAAGITTEGNILAISGEDYSVNASDIANVRAILLKND